MEHFARVLPVHNLAIRREPETRTLQIQDAAQILLAPEKTGQTSVVTERFEDRASSSTDDLECSFLPDEERIEECCGSIVIGAFQPAFGATWALSPAEVPTLAWSSRRRVLAC